jgi:hypothetical protein
LQNGVLLAGGVVLDRLQISQLVVRTGGGPGFYVHAAGMTPAPVPTPAPAPVSRQEVATQVVDKPFWEYAEFS